MRRLLFVTPIVVVALVGSTGCATKTYVGKNVAEISDQMNGRIDAVSKSVEETQERTKQNEARIKQVDQRTAAAAETAGAASRAAADAQTDADQALARAEDVERASRRLVYEVVLSDAQGNFTFGKADLSDTMKASIDDLIGKLKEDPQGVYIEIEGHTDTTGPSTVNERLALERAEAVKRYLYEHHQVPLHKMNVISYGEERPVAPNDTRQGRAENRRVVIKVLA